MNQNINERREKVPFPKNEINYNNMDSFLGNGHQFAKTIIK
jgi:hypothetical protein